MGRACRAGLLLLPCCLYDCVLLALVDTVQEVHMRLLLCLCVVLS